MALIYWLMKGLVALINKVGEALTPDEDDPREEYMALDAVYDSEGYLLAASLRPVKEGDEESR